MGNVAIVRQVLETFNSGAVDAVLESGLWWPEAALDATQSGIPGLGLYEGVDEVRRFFEDDWFGAFPFDEWEVHMEEMSDYGADQVVGVTRQHGRGASSGAASELELFNIFTLRDGQVVHLRIFTDRGRFEEALGR